MRLRRARCYTRPAHPGERLEARPVRRVILHGRIVEQRGRPGRGPLVPEGDRRHGRRRPARDGAQARRGAVRRDAGAGAARPRLRPEPLRVAPAGAELRQPPRRPGFDVFNLDLRGHGRSRHFGARRCHGVEDYVQRGPAGRRRGGAGAVGQAPRVDRRSLARRARRVRRGAARSTAPSAASSPSAARTTSRAAR